VCGFAKSRGDQRASSAIGTRALIASVLLAVHFGGAPAQAAEKVQVVASFSIIADLVRQVGGERVELTALAGPNADMHVFQPTPADAKALASANLVVINGLGYEGWADRLVKSSGYKGAALVASKGIKALAAGEHGRSHGDKKGHPARRYDPHAWQDVANVKAYVANIRDALIAVDAAGKPDYERAAANYLKQLDALDAEIKAAFAGIPKARRRVITSHEAFTYYGDAYDIAFLAPQGVTGDSEPTAKDVASLIRQIKREQVKAVFVENISNPRVIERIAKETGTALGGTLYSDALSEPGGAAASYIDMMRHNTRLFAAAMR
jgi:zinc/manganese transport system substrate-binding protein